MREQLEKMTVVELKALAKERHVKLSAGITKQGIIDRLVAADSEAEPKDSVMEGQLSLPLETVKEPSRPPVRTASIITDDEAEDEDPPVFTVNRNLRQTQPVIRSAPTQDTAKEKPASSLASISSKAPAFTLEGSRSWHNPRTYQAQPSGYGTRSGSWNASAPRTTAQERPADSRYTQSRNYPARDAAYPQRTDSAYPARQPVTYNRFGPETHSDTHFGPDPRSQAAPYRAEYSPRTDYAPRQEYTPRSQEYASQDNYAHQESQPVSAPVNEMLATGECGDTTGILEVLPDGYGFLRSSNLCPGKNDVYVSNAQIRRFSLRNGDQISGKTRPQREGDRYSALLYITQINGQNAEEDFERASFDSLTACYPTRRLNLSAADLNNPLLTAMDLLCPIGYGQRAAIMAPSDAIRQVLLDRMSAQASVVCPTTKRILLLIDKRPEDIVLRRKAFDGEVMYSSMENGAESHVHAAELCIERAMRLAEQKDDVVLFVDSFTALCKAYSASAPQGVRSLPCGLAAGSVYKAKRLFSAARALEEGGSITILGFFDSDPADPVSQTILQEFSGAANMSLWLDEDANEADGFGPDFSLSATDHASGMLNDQEMAAAKSLRDTLANSQDPRADINRFLSELK